MDQIKNVATQNDYADALTLINPRADHLDLVVAGASVFAEFKPHSDDDQELDWTPERLLLPLQGPFPNTSGVRLRSALANAPAQVVAQLLLPGEPRSGGVPFTGFLAASNAVGTTLALQTGDIFWSTIAPPYTGALLCDGSHYNALTDPTLQNLWAQIGIGFGGTAESDFAVPDLRDRVMVGAGGNTALAGNEGVAAANRHGTRHQHTVTDPGHVHAITDPGHAHSLPNAPSSSGAGLANSGVSNTNAGVPPTFNAQTGITVNAHATGISVGAAGDPLDEPGFLGLYAYIVK